MKRNRPCNCGHKKQEHHWRFFYPKRTGDGREFCYGCLPGGFKYAVWGYAKHKSAHGYKPKNNLDFIEWKYEQKLVHK